jgi:hypothetical protein
MAVFRPIKATALPADPAPHSVYFIKGGSDVRVKGYVTDAAGTAFPLGIIDEDDVRSVKLDGFTVGSNTAINSDNSIFTAFRNTQAQLNSLSTAVAGGIKIPLPIDCSANPNYPPAAAGDSYLVTVGGRIGGASGLLVQAGDKIIAQQTNAGGNQATVGSAWYIIQGNIDLATTTTSGITRIATDTETNAGSENFAYVTPSTLRGGVRNTTLTGYAVGSNAALAATDTVLGAFGKVQGQLDAKANSSALAAYLPLTGGTLTGALNGTSATFSGNVKTGRIIEIFHSFNPYIKLNVNDTQEWQLAGESGKFAINNGTSGTNLLSINTTGAATFSSSVTAVQASIGYTTAAPTNGLIVNGNVGIGTSSPSARLTVRSTGTTSSTFGLEVANSSGNSRLSVRDDGESIFYGAALTETVRITATGNVGIGTTTPARLLHVAGSIRLTGTAAPASPAAGDQYFDSGTNRMRFRDGTSSWIDMGMFWESAGW